ncbi:unnamed protein product [Trichobilharzia regenti]|nr:unnamed protein product [Trichobilharzia regenti]
MKQRVEGDELKDKIPEDDRKKVLSKCEETIQWLDQNQQAEKDEYEYHQKELEGVCAPIITKMYQAAGGGGMPGGMPEGFPGAGGASSGGGKGPTIEEVD